MKNGKYIDGIKGPARTIGEIDERWKNNMVSLSMSLKPGYKKIEVK